MNKWTVNINLNTAGSNVQATTGGTQTVYSLHVDGFLVSGAANQWEAINGLQPYTVGS